MTSDELRLIGKKLDATNRGRWTGQSLELQDGGQTLLVSVEVDSDAEMGTIEAIGADIKAILRPHVPMRPADYAWMAVIKKAGSVVESVMGGCSGSLPEI